MQLHKGLVATAALMVSTQVAALEPGGGKVTNTGGLVELCSLSADDPRYDAAMGFCYGYIDAALDYHAALTAGGKYKPIACPDEGVTRAEVVTVLLEWAKGSSQYLSTETPVQGVMRAVAAKWPCPVE